MIYKQHSPRPEHVRVIFELPSCIWADKICLTGDFNDWHEANLPLTQTRSGVWRIELDLPAGRRYEFRYLIDGRWQTDYHADESVSNRYGSDNSVVVTELPPPVFSDGPGDSLVRESVAPEMFSVEQPAGQEFNAKRAEIARRLPWLARLELRKTVESAA